MARQESHVQASLQQRLSKLGSVPEDEPRRQALMAASRFKSTWVDLACALTAVRDQGAYHQWGFKTFEGYCKQELHLRQETVLKLTRSFAYLQQHAPHKAHNEAQQGSAPSLDLVHLLSQAAGKTQLSQQALDAIGQQLLGQDGEPGRADALKVIRQSDPQAFRKPKSMPVLAPKTISDRDLHKALLLAERLHELLSAQGDAVSLAAHRVLTGVVEQLRTAWERVGSQQSHNQDSNLSPSGQMH